MDLDEFFPKYTPHTAGHSEVILEKTKTRIRELADYFKLTLDIDKKISQVLLWPNIKTKHLCRLIYKKLIL